MIAKPSTGLSAAISDREGHSIGCDSRASIQVVMRLLWQPLESDARREARERERGIDVIVACLIVADGFSIRSRSAHDAPTIAYDSSEQRNSNRHTVESVDPNWVECVPILNTTTTHHTISSPPPPALYSTTSKLNDTLNRKPRATQLTSFNPSPAASQKETHTQHISHRSGGKTLLLPFFPHLAHNYREQTKQLTAPSQQQQAASNNNTTRNLLKSVVLASALVCACRFVLRPRHNRIHSYTNEYGRTMRTPQRR